MCCSERDGRWSLVDVYMRDVRLFMDGWMDIHACNLGWDGIGYHGRRGWKLRLNWDECGSSSGSRLV